MNDEFSLVIESEPTLSHPCDECTDLRFSEPSGVRGPHASPRAQVLECACEVAEAASPNREGRCREIGPDESQVGVRRGQERIAAHAPGPPSPSAPMTLPRGTLPNRGFRSGSCRKLLGFIPILYYRAFPILGSARDMPIWRDRGFGMAKGVGARPQVPRSFMVWAVVALAGSLLVFVIGTNLYTRLVAFLVFLVMWTVVWQIAVGIGESEAELRAKNR